MHILYIFYALKRAIIHKRQNCHGGNTLFLHKVCILGNMFEERKRALFRALFLEGILVAYGIVKEDLSTGIL